MEDQSFILKVGMKSFANGLEDCMWQQSFWEETSLIRIAQNVHGSYLQQAISDSVELWSRKVNKGTINLGRSGLTVWRWGSWQISHPPKRGWAWYWISQAEVAFLDSVSWYSWATLLYSLSAASLGHLSEDFDRWTSWLLCPPHHFLSL